MLCNLGCRQEEKNQGKGWVKSPLYPAGRRPKEKLLNRLCLRHSTLSQVPRLQAPCAFPGFPVLTGESHPACPPLSPPHSQLISLFSLITKLQSPCQFRAEARRKLLYPVHTNTLPFVFEVFKDASVVTSDPIISGQVKRENLQEIW